MCQTEGDKDVGEYQIAAGVFQEWLQDWLGIGSVWARLQQIDAKMDDFLRKQEELLARLKIVQDKLEGWIPEVELPEEGGEIMGQVFRYHALNASGRTKLYHVNTTPDGKKKVGAVYDASDFVYHGNHVVYIPFPPTWEFASNPEASGSWEYIWYVEVRGNRGFIVLTDHPENWLEDIEDSTITYSAKSPPKHYI